MNRLHAVLGRIRSAGEALFALAVLALVVLLVAPLPPVALDAGIALNLGIAATVLVVSLFASDALRFASFPTLLLLTTLYRLALNISSTRLVLSRGEAGRVIQAFGKVVVQGNYVVGAVVFAILTLVQLIVVTKGAERVAEVAARFTLDALPGKQMSIDADLRAGLLDAGEAQRRRRTLERESQLYGAMDGALKFVKGDAIAGIAIVLVNVVGGLVSGAMRGMELGDAARRYVLLAIGDGLVSQIPSLLIAVAAGVAVTRVSAEEEGASLGGEMGRQLLAEPRALWAVGALLGALALAPGLPALPFLALAGAAGGGAFALSRRRAGRAAPAGPTPGCPAGMAGEGEPADPFSPPSPVALALAPDLLEASVQDARFLRETLPAMREQLWQELGVRLPGMSVRAGTLEPGRWALLLEEVPVTLGGAPLDERVAVVNPEELELVGIRCRAELDPLTGARLALISSADAGRTAGLCTLREPLERVAVGALAALKRHAHELIGIEDVQAMLEGLEGTSPALAREAMKQISPPLLAEVLRRLVEEGVSVRPLRLILEAILEAGGGARGAAALADTCRRALRRQIAHRCADWGPLEALLLDPRAEAVIREALAGESAALDPETESRILERLSVEVGRLRGRPVLLTSQDVRRAVRNLVASHFPRLSVVSYEELPPEQSVRPLGRLALPE